MVITNNVVLTVMKNVILAVISFWGKCTIKDIGYKFRKDSTCSIKIVYT